MIQQNICLELPGEVSYTLGLSQPLGKGLTLSIPETLRTCNGSLNGPFVELHNTKQRAMVYLIYCPSLHIPLTQSRLYE